MQYHVVLQQAMSNQALEKWSQEDLQQKRLKEEQEGENNQHDEYLKKNQREAAQRNQLQEENRTQRFASTKKFKK